MVKIAFWMSVIDYSYCLCVDLVKNINKIHFENISAFARLPDFKQYIIKHPKERRLVQNTVYVFLFDVIKA